MHAHGRFANMLPKKKRVHCQKWTEQETNFFFEALTELGTDFSKFAAWKTKRYPQQQPTKWQRGTIKNKYNKEYLKDVQRVKTIVEEAHAKNVCKIESESGSHAKK